MVIFLSAIYSLQNGIGYYLLVHQALLVGKYRQQETVRSRFYTLQAIIKKCIQLWATFSF